MLLLLHAIIPCLHTWIVIHLCGSMNSELRTIYVSSVWSNHNQLFTMHHSGYYNRVSFIFGTTIPTSFIILMKCFLHLYNSVLSTDATFEVRNLNRRMSSLAFMCAITQCSWILKCLMPSTIKCQYTVCTTEFFFNEKDPRLVWSGCLRF